MSKMVVTWKKRNLFAVCKMDRCVSMRQHLDKWRDKHGPDGGNIKFISEKKVVENFI